MYNRVREIWGGEGGEGEKSWKVCDARSIIDWQCAEHHSKTECYFNNLDFRFLFHENKINNIF